MTHIVTSQIISLKCSLLFPDLIFARVNVEIVISCKFVNTSNYEQVRWPNGNTNTYRDGAEGAHDLLVHPAVGILKSIKL